MDEEVISKRPSAPPAATGDAGGEFQAKVGAQYLLAALAGASPRGLPGATIKQVQFQQFAAGYPFDDVVIEALNADGSSATLEVQAKRSINFTKNDAFKDIVARMWQAAQKPGFATTRYELAVAIAHTTTRTEKSCQEVLNWARRQPSGAAFRLHLNRFASAQMNDFVEAFRQHLVATNAPVDDETVWRMLSRFQILVFDFANTGSREEDFALDRARLVLALDQAGEATKLCAVLVGEAAALHASGGVSDRAQLIRKLAREHPFRFGPSRDLSLTLARLAESTRHALADISDEVGGVRLPRSDLLDKVDRSLESARLIEIVGEPGAGKSALLAQLAFRVGSEGTALMVAPDRIIGGGWLKMESVLDCPVALKELLSELGAGGSSVLFIDNVDQVEGDAEKTTIRDLVRDVVASPGWRIVVTMGPGGEEWRTSLSKEVKQLGNLSVIVGEITDDEAVILAGAMPALASVLDQSHPAHHVARNLFYLSRLVDEPAIDGTASTLVSELALATAWWQRGGGRAQAGKGERLKVLRALAARFVERPGVAAQRTDDFNGTAIEELIRANTIRPGRAGATASFRHDVLRDWAIGFLLHEEQERLASLATDQPIPRVIARAIEIAARLALESDASGAGWVSMLSALERPGAHGSWRRPVLLSLPRSENAATLLDRVKAALVEDKGRRLGEMIRFVITIDSEPLAKVLAAREEYRALLPSVPSGFVVPTSQSWWNLIQWLLRNMSSIPSALIPDIAKLFQQWIIFTQGWAAPVNALLVGWLHVWLVRIEKALQPVMLPRGAKPPEEDRLDFDHVRDVRDDIRMTFLSFAYLSPELAAGYLKSLREMKLRHHEAESILRMPGSLPRAAPAELVDFALEQLIPGDDEEEVGFANRDRFGPFDLTDRVFFPASPSQAPFLELLTHARAEGLRLVRTLVDHATDWRFANAGANVSTVEVSFPGGERTFVGDFTVYHWPRGNGGSPAVTSALMALEAWGHAQIEVGRPIKEVLADVLGPDGGSAAFLAVAVDLILSHWGLAKPEAWPFLASPALLWHDKWRYTYDSSGVGRSVFLGKEPAGRVKNADLSAWPSRQNFLLNQLGDYAVLGPVDLYTKLKTAFDAAGDEILSQAETPNEDPTNGLRATVLNARRRMDKANYVGESVRLADGEEVIMLQYQSPPEEEAILDPARAHSAENLAELHVRLRLQKALLEPRNSNAAIVAEGIAWARGDQRARKGSEEDDAFDNQWRARAIVMAAALAARDYEGADRPDIEAWSRTVLGEAISSEEDPSTRMSVGVEFHKAALAAIGLISLYRRRPDSETLRTLLSAASSDDGAIITVIADKLAELAAIDERLPRSFLRVVVVGAIRPRRSYYPDEDEKADAEKQARFQERVTAAIEAERRWLAGDGEEPLRPELPLWPSRPKHHFRIPLADEIAFAADEEDNEPPAPPEHYVDEQAIGNIVMHLRRLIGTPSQGWVVRFASELVGWTIEANNGTNDDDSGDRDNRPDDWNNSFFALLGSLCAVLPFEEGKRLFLEPLATLDEEPFNDMVATFLLGVDGAVLDAKGVHPSKPEAIRAFLVQRLMARGGWAYHATRRGFTAESHLARALNAMFFHPPIWGQGRPYIPARHEQLPSYMPAITEIVVGAPSSGYLASLFLALIETSPTWTLLPFVARAVEAWSNAIGVDPDFWLDKAVGTRVCAWLDTVLSAQVPGGKERTALTKALDVMIASGVAQARDVEARLLEGVGRVG